jgi:hypothetical protein
MKYVIMFLTVFSHGLTARHLAQPDLWFEGSVLRVPSGELSSDFRLVTTSCEVSPITSPCGRGALVIHSR